MMDDLLNMADQDWRDQAACKGADIDLFVTAADGTDQGAHPIEAMRYCQQCPVRLQCLEEGMYLDGVWGGTTERARRDVRNGRTSAVHAMALGDRIAGMMTSEERAESRCSRSSCSDRVHAKGLCVSHYRKALKRPSEGDGLWRVEQIARDHGVDVGDIVGGSRREVVVAARHEAMVTLVGLGWSYSATGRLLNKDHTSVLHAVKKSLKAAA